MTSPLTRREWLLQTAAASTTLSLAVPQVLARRGTSERVRLGIIGVGGQGRFHLNSSTKQDVVALCDIDRGRLEEAAKMYPKAQRFEDFRHVLDLKELDAVIICTPDHTHAPIASAALRSGRDVYCEKPLTHSVAECRRLIELAREHKRITQMGTQIHAGTNYRRVVELVQAKAIGEIAEVHVWVGTSYSGGDRPKDTPPIPPGINYDLWLGPAPQRNYHPSHFHFKWRGWWDYGGGATADMACHHMDLPFWALGLKAPVSVRAEGPAIHPDSTPPWQIVHYQFPARGELPPVKLTWYCGGKQPPHIAAKQIPAWGAGTLFVGSKGMLIADYGKYKLLPEKDFEGFVPPPRSIPDSIGHHNEFFEAIKTRRPTTCHFDYSGTLTEAVLLANVAYRAQETITWDAASLKTNSLKADAYLRREYRKGWEL